MIFAQAPTNFLEQAGYLVRFHRDYKSFSEAGDIRVSTGYFRAGGRIEMCESLIGKIARDHSISGAIPGFDETFGEGSGHFARAQETDAPVLWHAVF